MRTRRSSFTLIELLVVISIIGLLAAMLLPALAAVKQKAKIGQCKLDMAQLGMAISEYESTYSHPPYPDIFRETNGSPADITFGGWGSLLEPYSPHPDWAFYPTNADVMRVLMDVPVGVNAAHIRNPQRQGFFAGRLTASTNSPGVSTVDYEFRDPWGHHYNITLDMDGDGKSRDCLYRERKVSQVQPDNPQGANGLYNSVDIKGTGDNYEWAGPFMIWSMGPDGLASGAYSANTGPNKDNILGWR